MIAVGNQNVLLYHEQAYLNTEVVQEEVKRKFMGDSLLFIEVTTDQVSIKEAVNTYFFNTQLVTLVDNSREIIASMHCRENKNVYDFLQKLIAGNNPNNQVKFFDVNESMKNGGGPACLRLRVALTEDGLAAVNPACLLSDALYQQLVDWVNVHYRDQLMLDDLRDPQLLMESRTALDNLSQLLSLGSVYRFQQ